MSRPWSDIDPEEEKLLAQWNRDTAPSNTGCLSAEMVRASVEECLPEPELSRARQHLAQCPMCAALAQDLSAFEMSGPTPLESRRMRAKIGLPVEPVPEQARPWWAKVAPWVLAAGCAALAVGVWTRISQPTTGVTPTAVVKSGSAQRLPVQPAAVRMPLTSLVWRGEEKKSTDAYPAALAKALEPYGAGKYAEAIAALQPIAAEHPRRAEGHFYLGVSLLMANRDADAITPLENARAALDSPIRSEIDWYLAVALRNSGRTTEAAVLFRSLCDNAGVHQKEACAALAQN